LSELKDSCAVALAQISFPYTMKSKHLPWKKKPKPEHKNPTNQVFTN